MKNEKDSDLFVVEEVVAIDYRRTGIDRGRGGSGRSQSEMERV